MRREDTLLYFVEERESIRIAKEAGQPAPWTKDPILQKYRFCNIRRRDDRVSRWLLKHVLTEANLKANYESFLQFSMFCRYVNWPPTIQDILDITDIRDGVNWHIVGEILYARRKAKYKTFTGAYMVKSVHDEDKVKYVVDVVRKGFREHGYALVGLMKYKSLELLYKELRSWYGVGPFMAGQVLADWTYVSLLSDADDLYEWAPIGPGSRRGYNRLMGIEPIRRWPATQAYLSQLIEWRWAIIRKLGNDYEDMTLHDVQNCLCEVDKYLRVKSDEGRPRSMYKSETAYKV